MNQFVVYIGKRLISLGVVVFLISVFVFVVFFIQMGDPSRILVPRASPELVQLVREDLKLDEPITTQFINFETKVFSGKFFISIGVWKGASIAEGIYSAALRTLAVFGAVLVAAGLSGGTIGLLTSRSRENHAVSRVLRVLSVVSLAIPALVVATWLAYSAGPLNDGMNSIVVGASAFLASWSILVLMEKGKERYYASFGKALNTPRTDGGARPMSASPMTKLFAGWTLTAVLTSEAVVGQGNHGLGVLLWDSLLSRDFTLLMSIIVVLGIILATTNFLLDMVSPLAKRYVASMRGGEARFQADVTEGRPSNQELEPYNPLLSLSGIKSFASEFVRLPFGMLALVLLLVLVVLAVLAPVISTVKDPMYNLEPSFFASSPPHFNPFPPSLAPSPVTGYVHPFGTDANGGDVYSLILSGISDAIGAILLLVIVSALAASVVWILAIALIRARGPKSIFGAFGSVVSDFALALPLLAFGFASMFVLEPVNRGWSLLSWLLRISILLAFALVFFSARTRQGSISHLVVSSDGSVKRAFSGAIPHVIYVSKFVGLLTFVALVALVTLGFGSPYGGPGSPVWGLMLGRAFDSLAYLSGAWWELAFPTIFIVLLVSVVYFLIDCIEVVAWKRWGQLSDVGNATKT